MTAHFDNYETTAKKIIERVGKTIVLGVPLGIGKPIGILNAFFRLASADPSIKLTIITGLTLARPLLHNELEKRFVAPILDRILKDYEDPLYEHARELQQLPDNIQVIEFFLNPAKYLHNSYVQQNYVSSKYTSVVHDSLHYSLNVFAQQVAHSQVHSEKYSLSSNTDLFHDVTNHLLNESKFNDKKIAVVAEINSNLPFMLGDAVVNSEIFTEIVDTKQYRPLFAIPREEISVQDHLIGLYTSYLIKDNGSLQIGIGKLSNAVANALIFRHKQNSLYQNLFKQLSIDEKFGETILEIGSTTPFDKGLYAPTEMLSDEFMQLFKEKILKKRVYDHIGLQKLLNSNEIGEKVTPEFIDILINNRIISPQLTKYDLIFLQKFGIFKSNIGYQTDHLVLSSGETVSSDLTSPTAKQEIIEKCLGDSLKSGKIIHAGFFLGGIELYKQLRNLSPDELQLFDMTSIKKTNTLFATYELSRLQRQQARYINSAMMVTLGGAIVSDGLKNMQEVSGVGGQFDFVSMAQNLEGARSIINCRSTRMSKNKMTSNVVWDYPNLTIPRYLRDIVITEYGIADCRSKTDAEVIKSILNITDSHFQEQLLKKAKQYGKLPSNYEIPKCFQQNHYAMIKPIISELQSKGYFKPYPFGSDLTEEENTLQHALLFLKDFTKFKLVVWIFASLFFFRSDAKFDKYLHRMKLTHPENIKDFIYKKLLKYVIAKQEVS